MSRTIAITSGKGGTGKTTLAVSLAAQLAALGHRTCIFDADLGTANVNIMLGINPQADIGDVVKGSAAVRDIIIQDPAGIDIIPGSSGVEEVANLGAKRLASLVTSFDAAGAYDFYLFDTGAGISRRVLAFCLAAAEVVLVITDEPTSLTDAYALLKVLTKHQYGGRIRVVINRCPDLEAAKKVYRRFRVAVDFYLGLPLEPLGVLFQDRAVPASMQQQRPFIELFPKSKAADCIRLMARRLSDGGREPATAESIVAFWNHYASFCRLPLELAARGAKEEAHRGEEVVAERQIYLLDLEAFAAENSNE
ncbi:MinD/ParA family protein [Desulfurivibrio alkaliphilus]|uniref:Cobyrinic acid ac-diamide synthase n=1 Tax=Desulfurivibrio alkaliphilus (strain DSM 19089 / UNIQEM U267 / AHT2) TaxID=589865 RepID=D6Z6J3_DESAT|nr:MinD/ParA family protein [Desulfurivibrio alkaliphilus]ADH84952.1 Cobyrinic acid ac-diamide synthase [Desulfurivibrio alkaliphilus AHT 2]